MQVSKEVEDSTGSMGPKVREQNMCTKKQLYRDMQDNAGYLKHFAIICNILLVREYDVMMMKRDELPESEIRYFVLQKNITP